METLNVQTSEDVDIFCLTHTTKPHALQHYLENSDLKALIVLIYGMSGHREDLMEVLSHWAHNQ